MAITIAGIKVNDIHLEPNAEQGGYRIKSAEYSLIGSTGKILAKQSIGGYGGLVMEPSRETAVALEEFARMYQKDVILLLGLDG